MAKISYQRFFRLYHHLGGMTGTAKEVVNELWSVYGLPVVKIPTHKPNKRIHHRSQLFESAEKKWSKVVDRAIEFAECGRSVLIGTASVGLSELLSDRFQAKGVAHQILNAKQDDQEADIVARAGERGKITIATNMAGRGTDIKLSEEVRAEGGLHVLLTEFHDASRIDRQLEGRCARQGDPGSFEIFVSLEDDLIKSGNASILHRALLRLSKSRWLNQASKTKVGIWVLRSIQKKIEKRHANIRYMLLKSDEAERDMLSFVGHQV